MLTFKYDNGQNDCNYRGNKRNADTRNHKTAENRSISFQVRVGIGENRLLGLPCFVYVFIKEINVVCRSALFDFVDIEFEIERKIDFFLSEIHSRYQRRAFMQNVALLCFRIIIDRVAERGRAVKHYAFNRFTRKVFVDFKRIYFARIKIIHRRTSVNDKNRIGFFFIHRSAGRHSENTERQILFGVETIEEILSFCLCFWLCCIRRR